MRLQDNHLYVGNNDRLPQWTNMPNDEDGGKKELSPENEGKIIEKTRELIKNYLQLDSVNFLFGTGSSIHLGAASIQNIPKQAEEDIANSGDKGLQGDFKKYITQLQKSLKEANGAKKDDKFKDDRGWNVIYDGTYIRDYKVEVKDV